MEPDSPIAGFKARAHTHPGKADESEHRAPSVTRLPQHLLRKLQTDGYLDEDSYGRNARLARCTTCRQTVIRALDADRAALSVTTDTEPLSSAGEFVALVAGRPTYRLRTAGAKTHLDRRDRWQIRATPADTPGAHIVPAHDCGRRVPLVKPPDPQQTASAAQSDTPPF